MRALSAPELLAVWEQGLGLTLTQRALALLTAACPATSPETLAELSIGQRDGCLLTLREWIFGPQLSSVVTCPECGERLELSFHVADIRATGENETVEPLAVSVAGFQVQFRLLNSLDLASLAGAEDVVVSRRRLLERCLVEARHNGESKTLDQLPANVVDAIIEHMAEADPQADVQLALTCPACEHQWQAAFDIVSFFWQEISQWAYRVLREVHVLASAYGWSQGEILALSPLRRQLYLEMVSE